MAESKKETRILKKQDVLRHDQQGKPKNAGQYKTVAVGEIITVKGDIWKMENENHITVREIK